MIQFLENDKKNSSSSHPQETHGKQANAYGELSEESESELADEVDFASL